MPTVIPLRRATPLAAILAALLLPQCAAAARPTLDLMVDLGYEQNLLRAAASEDRFDDQVVTLAGTLGYPYHLGERSGIHTRLAFARSQYATYDAFDRTDASLSVTYRTKPGLAFDAPWYAIGIKGELLDYDDSWLRSGYRLGFEGVVGARLSERLSARLGAHLSERRADTERTGLMGGTLYDLREQRLFATADWKSGTLTWYGGVTLQWGDLVSTATPTPWIIAYADEIQWDSAIGANRWGYRIDADTRLYDVGVNIPVGRSGALDMALRRFDIDGPGAIDYDGYALHLGYLFRFQ